MTTPSFSVRFQYGTNLVDEPERAARLATALASPVFAPLTRAAARSRDRWGRYAKPSATRSLQYLLDRDADALSFDSGGRAEPVAMAELDNGSAPPRGEARVRNQARIVLPVADVASQVEAFLAVAEVLRVTAGYVSVEPTFLVAHRLAGGGSRPGERDGLGAERWRERRGRDWRANALADVISGPEWGTFLGAGHLEKVTAKALRDAGAFARVVELAADLVFLQLTANPLDDLDGEVERRLPAARAALAPVLMDLSDVSDA